MDSEEIGQRLVRIETKQDALISAFDEHRKDQKEHNENFYKTSQKVSSMVSAIKIIVPLITTIGGVLGWAISLFMGKK